MSATTTSRGAPRPAEAGGAVGAGHFRPDLEGLRAVAVVAVVLEHFWGFPRGGFVGVDVFFVLSGYLITGLLLREHRRTGHVSMLAFYRRRAWRLLPAAWVVIAATAVASSIVFFASRSTAIVADAVSSALMVQNWHLIRGGTDYFADTGSTSPLQHLWSLAVEEQFYVFWPWLVLMVGIAAARLSSGRADETVRRVLSGIVATVAVASFTVACLEVRLAPGWSYFSLESRLWEPAVGALAAIVLSRTPGPSPRWARRWSAVGLAAVLAAMLVVDPGWGFPGPWAALPVAGTLMVIVGGLASADRGSTPVQRLLTVRPVRYVGRISYSLYLWHLPVWVLGTAAWPTAGKWWHVVLAAVGVALAAATHRWVEVPARRRGRADPRAGRAEPRGRSTVVAAVGSALLVTACVVQVLGPADLTGVTARPAAAVDRTTTFPDAEAVTGAVALAASARSWPRLVPSPEDVGPADGAAASLTSHDCLVDPLGAGADDVDRQAASCSFGPRDAPRTAVVVGDSIAVSLLPGLIEAAVPQGWRVVGLGLNSCPAATVTVADRTGRPGFGDACARARQARLDWIGTAAPDLVVLSGALGSFDRLGSPTVAGGAWRSGMERTLRALPRAPQVAVVASPPESTSPTSCAVRTAGPGACLGGFGRDWLVKSTAERDAVTGAAGRGRASYVDTAAWFCTRQGSCPAFVGDTLVKVDEGHLTTQYSIDLGPTLVRALRMDTRP